MTGSRRLHADALVWDSVWPVDLPDELHLGNSWESLSRFAASGFNVVSITLAGDNHNSAQALRLVAWARREIADRAHSLRLVEEVEDVGLSRGSGQLGIILHFEGTRCFERNLDLIGAFYRLGVRQTLIAFNNANSAGGGCAEREDGGLTAYGYKLVREMQRVGMVVDLSHTGYRTSLDVFEMAEKPAVFSHSNMFALRPVFRNVRDEQIRACAKTGGVIGVSGSSEYLGDIHSSNETLFRHIDHVVNLVGADHVGLGLDCVFETDWLNAWARTRPDEWPMTRSPDWPGFRYAQPEQAPELTDHMLKRGYSDDDVRKVLGLNMLRVCRLNWR